MINFLRRNVRDEYLYFTIMYFITTIYLSIIYYHPNIELIESIVKYTETSLSKDNSIYEVKDGINTYYFIKQQKNIKSDTIFISLFIFISLITLVSMLMIIIVNLIRGLIGNYILSFITNNFLHIDGDKLYSKVYFRFLNKKYSTLVLISYNCYDGYIESHSISTKSLRKKIIKHLSKKMIKIILNDKLYKKGT